MIYVKNPPKHAAEISIQSIFLVKIMPKKQKIAELCFYFEFQVVVAVVGFKWHERGKAKNAD